VLALNRKIVLVGRDATTGAHVATDPNPPSIETERHMKPTYWIAVGVSLLGQACFFEADTGRGTGTLTVEWSIAGYIDSVDCYDNRADYLELVIYDRSGRYIAEVEAPCDSFNVSIDLRDGLYDADVTLIDAFDRAASVTIPIDQLDVRGGTELVVPIDFAYRDFL